MREEAGAGRTGPRRRRQAGRTEGEPGAGPPGRTAAEPGAGPPGCRGAARRAVDPAALRSISGRISAVEEQRDPQRRSVFVDGEFVLGLDLEVILRCGLKAGQPVDGEALWKACQMDQEKRAWEAGLRLLAAAPRTRRDVERRLARTYPPETVAAVAERLAAAGWLDDRAYALSYVRSHPDYGGRRLLADLVRKGVERPVAAEVVADELGAVEVVAQAREVAARRLGRMGAVDRATAERRLAGFLSRRGFGPDAIRQALEPLLTQLPPAPARVRNSNGLARRSALGQRRGLRRALPPEAEEEL